MNVGQAECDAVADTEVFLQTRQAMYAYRNTEVCSCNHFLSEEQSVLHISREREMRMCLIVICFFFGSTMFFHIIS